MAEALTPGQGLIFLCLELSALSLQQIVEQTVAGFGYDLVETERSAGGLLRVTIDLPWTAGAPEQFVNVEDCEKVTRQLQYALEVEAIEYKRLEVSSPGTSKTSCATPGM
jgi:ribosome maturation factor RimP